MIEYRTETMSAAEYAAPMSERADKISVAERVYSAAIDACDAARAARRVVEAGSNATYDDLHAAKAAHRAAISARNAGWDTYVAALDRIDKEYPE